jgi:hypothetical protein
MAMLPVTQALSITKEIMAKYKLHLYQLCSGVTLPCVRNGACCAASAVAGAELLSFV